MKTALFPGSFDPITLGHLDVIRRTAALFDKVYVTVFENTEKKSSHMFDYRDRLEMISSACCELPNVEADYSTGLLADYYVQKKIDVCIKGVRNVTDFDYEYWISLINRDLLPEFETLFLPSKAEFQFINSTFVREMIKYRKNLGKYIPESVISYMDKHNLIK